MARWFKKKRKELTPQREQQAVKIAGYLLKVQRTWADGVGRRFDRMGRSMQRAICVVLLLLSIGWSIWTIWRSVTE